MAAHVHVIAHTHWDREWYLTREQYRARLVDLIDRVLDRMAAEPAFTHFHLDGQTIVLEDYLELRPERGAELRGRIREGRLLVGPWYVMPDMFLVSGEALVRNLARGIRLANASGAVMRVGYMPDPFGHVAQMPQILGGFSLEGAILWRGLGGERAERIWEAPDGTRVLLVHLPREGYCNGLRLPLLPPDDMSAEAQRLITRERARSATDQVLLMVGVDHVEPHPALLRLVKALEAVPGVAAAELTTLPAYVDAVRRRTVDLRLGTMPGELRGGEDYAHLLPGVLSARTYLKQANARVERELERWAEPLSAFVRVCGAAHQPALLDYAWRVLLENHPHDSICGCSIDAVHEENVVRFARAEQAAEIVTTRAARALAEQLPAAPPDALRAIAVNTDSAPWSGILAATIEIPLEIAGPGAQEDRAVLEEPLPLFGSDAAISSITDHRLRPIAYQVLDTCDVVAHRMSRYVPPVPVRVRRVRTAIQVDEVPALGYAALDVHITRHGSSPSSMAAVDAAESNVIENDLIRVEANDDGTVDVFDKRGLVTYRGVFAIEDVGDVGDEYNFCPPVIDRRIINADVRDVRMTTVCGPLMKRLLIEFTLPVPAAAAPDRASRSEQVTSLAVALEIEVQAGSPAVACVFRVANGAKDHRLRVFVPTGAASIDVHRADTAFGIAERPFPKRIPEGALVEAPVEAAPMQSFVDAGDAHVGAVLVADGLVEYEPIQAADGVLTALTLLRAVGDLSRDDLATRRGHAGPGLATPGAQCPGSHEFRLAFVPRAEPPAPGALFRIARNVLSPPRVFCAAGGDGRLPAAVSFVQLHSNADGNVVLSACKCADEGAGIVLRVFNAGARNEPVVVSSSAPIATAQLVDLLEEPQTECAVEDNVSTFALGPHRIQTVKLNLRGYG